MISKLQNQIACVLICAGIVWSASYAQTSSRQREFSQSPVAVKKAIQHLASAMQGKLPTLEGFAESSDSLERFQRGYFQCLTQVTPGTSGGSVVKVKAKITAWYVDPHSANSGYRALVSNGRLEADFLAQLDDALNSVAENTGSKIEKTLTSESKEKAESSRQKSQQVDGAMSAPMPGGSVLADAISSSRTPLKSAPGSRISAGGGTGVTAEQRHNAELEKEAQSLQEILRNQAHPTNLAAVKASGTPVMTSPNEGAKILFQADAEDEFEVLDMNSSWVHVRISGLSRGWVLRSALELPDESNQVPSAVPENANSEGKDTVANSVQFQVESEQTASFPGEWEALRGKTVKIVAVQKAGSGGTDARAKLAYAKSVLSSQYRDLVQSGSTASGVVIVFDSEDGGMMAATMPVLKLWKSGSLSDEALWRRCYFDPPEMFAASAGQ